MHLISQVLADHVNSGAKPDGLRAVTVHQTAAEAHRQAGSSHARVNKVKQETRPYLTYSRQRIASRDRGHRSLARTASRANNGRCHYLSSLSDTVRSDCPALSCIWGKMRTGRYKRIHQHLQFWVPRSLDMGGSMPERGDRLMCSLPASALLTRATLLHQVRSSYSSKIRNI